MRILSLLPTILATALLVQSDEQLSSYFKRHPEADANRDGVLTCEEARSHRRPDPSRGDKLNSRSAIAAVRCFITRLLTYANGADPEDADFVEIEKILARSAAHKYRVVETIAAMIDSPLFREK